MENIIYPQMDTAISTLRLDDVSGTVQFSSFCDWLISVAKMSIRFIHVVVYSKFPSFKRLNNIPLCIYVYLSHFLNLHIC